MATPRVLIPMADYGHDPTETAVPYTAFKKAGFKVDFATETGKAPECDQKLLTGWTQKMLGATGAVIESYNAMSSSPEWTSPRSWSAADFDVDEYNLIFLPGGHEKGVRQVIDSPIIHAHLAAFFPQTLRVARQPKAVGAVCHGVMVLSEASYGSGEDVDAVHRSKCVLHDVETTALPARFEQLAYHGTRLFLGDYYKTYGAGSDDVEEAVAKRLDDRSQFKSSLGMGPFVVEDQKYNYISARFPGDADLLAEKVVKMVNDVVAAGHK